MLSTYAEIMAGELQFRGSGARHIHDPIAIGAVGGSGTRLLATLLERAGTAMATPLNEAGDALEWPPMNHLLSRQMLKRYPREAILRNAFHGFERLLSLRRHNLGMKGRVGWKVPATHLWLGELAEFFPRMQYIHLLRNGLDMAYSGNQRQVKLWARSEGVAVEHGEDGRVAPRSVMEYWLQSNEKALELGRSALAERMLVVRYESLCRHPEAEIARILDFIGMPPGPGGAAALAALVRVPPSVGRFRNHHWQGEFSELQFNRLAGLGYPVSAVSQPVHRQPD